VFISLQYSTERWSPQVARENCGMHARRNGEIHVTDFGGFDGAAWLG
jgi:hypothetical protein